MVKSMEKMQKEIDLRKNPDFFDDAETDTDEDTASEMDLSLIHI